MTDYTNVGIANGLVQASADPLFTADAKYLIKTLQLFNTDAATQVVNIYRQRGALGVMRQVARVELEEFEFADVVDPAQSWEMDTDDVIYASATTINVVEFFIDGVAIT